MRASAPLSIGIGLVVFLLGTSYASNMGFTLPIFLAAQAPEVSRTGMNQISLPYNPEDGIRTASGLWDSINRSAGAADCTGAACPVVSISRLLVQTDVLQTYSSGIGGAANDFPILGHEGLRIQVRQNVPWLAIGAHDPGRVIRFQAQAPGLSATGQVDFSLPYHSTVTTSGELFNAINASSATGDAVVSISRLVRSNDSLQTYDQGPFGAINLFELSAGESYRIQVHETVDYLPTHF